MHSRAVRADRKHLLKFRACLSAPSFAQKGLGELIMGIRAVGANLQCVSGVEYAFVNLILPQRNSGESIVCSVVPRIDGKSVRPKGPAVAPDHRLFPAKAH